MLVCKIECIVVQVYISSILLFLSLQVVSEGTTSHAASVQLFKRLLPQNELVSINDTLGIDTKLFGLASFPCHVSLFSSCEKVTSQKPSCYKAQFFL